MEHYNWVGGCCIYATTVVYLSCPPPPQQFHEYLLYNCGWHSVQHLELSGNTISWFGLPCLPCLFFQYYYIIFQYLPLKSNLLFSWLLVNRILHPLYCTCICTYHRYWFLEAGAINPDNPSACRNGFLSDGSFYSYRNLKWVNTRQKD